MPDWKSYVRGHLPAMRVKPSRESEIVEELAAQLEQAYEDALRTGRAPDEAERMAAAQLSDWRRLAAEIETAQPAVEQVSARFWHGLGGDLRHAFRALRKSPVFTAIAIATLAIGIGGCTTIFSLLEAVLLRPIGFRDPDGLTMVWEYQYKKGFHKNVVAMADYLDWKARNHVFTDMSPVLNQVWNVSGQGAPVSLRGLSVNERFLPMLGVQPLAGRGFTAEESRAGGARVALISYRLWAQRFGAAARAIGSAINLDDQPWTIIGVLPADFPWLGPQMDVLTPAQLPNRDWRVRAGRFLRVVARLRPGVRLTDAQTELSAIARQLETEYPQFNKDWGVEITPLSDQFAGSAATSLWVLMGAVALVLLIACSNVANLMLARAVTREREIAVRTALGATRRRIARLLLIESVVLAVLGGAAGSAGAYAAVRLIQTYGPRDVARLDTAGVNPTVILFTLLASLLTGAAFGLAPVLSIGRVDLGAALKEGGRGLLNTVRGERARGFLVVGQVALALVLLTGATLMIESLLRLSRVPPGFDPRNVLTGSVSISGRIDNERLANMCREIIERLRALPGVENASFTTFLPFSGPGAATGFTVVGRPPYGPGQEPVADVRTVQPGYFETMRIPLLRGRVFTDSDNSSKARRVYVVNEALTRQMFADGDPLGQSLVVHMGDDTPGEIIGVVADTKHNSLEQEVRPMVYYVQAHLPISFGAFVVRTRTNAGSLRNALISTIQSVKRDQPVTDVLTMEEWIGQSIARLRFQTALLGAFALIAVVLALIGVYGVMAYAVEQRTVEIGIRLALGAEPRGLRRWIAARGMRLAALGILIGIAGAGASTRVLKSLLYGVAPMDARSFAAAAVLLAVACIAASYVPARRATAIDPATALRGE